VKRFIAGFTPDAVVFMTVKWMKSTNPTISSERRPVMNSTLKRFTKNVLFILPLVLLLSAAADCTGQTSGSKHRPASNMSDFQATLSVENPAAAHPVDPSPQKGRFVDNGDGTVTDRKTNLMWIKNGRRLEFISALTWWDAIQKSNGIKVGGHDNWRLPTLEEWSSLIDTRHQSPALVEPSPFKNIVTHMPYWTMTEFIYGKDHTCSKECPLETYTVMLYYGNIGHQKKTDRAFILPVRSID
jgi:hypothetical protein